MAVYLVTYDLNAQGKDYDGLINAIKAYGSYCKLQKSVWFIGSGKTASEIRDDLKRHIDQNDDLFVGEMKKHWAGANKMKCVDWLKSDNRSWG